MLIFKKRSRNRRPVLGVVFMLAKMLRLAIKGYSATIGPHAPHWLKWVLRSWFSLFGFSKIITQEAEKDTLRFYRNSNIISHGDLVFDIGAHWGCYTEAFLALGARVVAVEPDPSAASKLRMRFGSNPNVAVVEAGAGSKIGEMDLYVGEMSGIATFSDDFRDMTEKHYKGNYVYKTRAKLTTLDLLIKEHGTPKYCKVDVEGFEEQVFAGLTGKIAFISFEFHRERLDAAKACAGRLSELGDATFNYTHFDPAHLGFCLGEWVDVDKLFKAIKEESSDIAKESGDVNFWRVGDIFARIE